MKRKKIFVSAGISWLEGIMILILAFACVYGILQKAQTFDSGYHLVDDHELIRMEFSFQNGSVSLGQAMTSWIQNDFYNRYRPLYWVERVTCTFLWGSELLYWNYYTAVKGILAFILLYFMARFLKYNRVVSAMLPCVVMLGSQFTPWYRSANQESTGLLLAAFVLCMIAAQAYYHKYKAWYYNSFIVAGAILCGLVKESFTLFMPIFIALKLWLEYWEEGKEPAKGDFLRCLQGNAVTYGMIFMAMIVNVGMILFRVGVDKVSYAGFQKGTPLWVYKQGIENSLFIHMKSYTYVGVLIFLLAVVCYKAIEKKDIMKYVCLAIIGACIMAIQLAAHAKSGMWERYMIPYTIAYGLVFVLLAYHFFERDKIHKMVYYVVLLGFIGNGIKTAYQGSLHYAEDGRSIHAFLNEVYTQTEEDDDIVCAFYDEELNLSVESWLEAHGRTKTYTWINDGFKNEIQLAGSAPEQYRIEDVDALVCYEWQAEDMRKLLEIGPEEDCEMYYFNGYLLIIV